jgi:hypothetical protein
MKLPHIAFTLAVLVAISPYAYSVTICSRSVSSYGTIQPDFEKQQQIVILRHLIETWAFTAEETSNSDIWSGHYDALCRVPELRALNPNIICLLYRNIRTVWGPNNIYEYNAAQLQLFMDKEWILKDENSNFVTDENGDGYFVDVGNSEYQNWLALWLEDYVLEYSANGVFLDNCLASSEIAWGCSQIPMNPRTNLPWTDDEWHDAVVSLANTVKTTLGENRIVFANGIFNGNNWINRLQYYQGLMNSQIDGIMSEGWISDYSKTTWYDESTWKKSVDMAVWINDNFLSKENKFFIALCGNAAESTTPSGATLDQYALFSYASLLLAASNNGNTLNYGSFLIENRTQNLFKTEVGTPKNSYAIIQGTHIYTRDFTNIKVLVNPTDQTYTVNLNKEYYLNNNQVSTVVVQPHTGILLEIR